MKKNALGKGLEALFEDNDIEINERQVQTVKINDIEPNRDQPRKFFDKDKMEELASSIGEHGILQPIIVKPEEAGRYKIISGERRWRAARMAGIIDIPVIIRDIDDQTCAEIALIENLQREDLNIIEEAKGYRQLMNDYALTQETIAKRVGKSRPVIANALRILSLPEETLALVEDGSLTSGHARALLPLYEKLSEKDFAGLIKDILEKNMTVRDLENLYKKLSGKPQEKQQKKQDIYLAEIERDISEAWGRKVRITSAKNKGKIELEFYNSEDFDNLVEILKTINR